MNTAESLSQAVVVQTLEEERYRIARALQNGAGQLLANATMEIETALDLMDGDPVGARDGLRALLAELKQGLEDVRQLVSQLQPPLLTDFGLAASVQKAAADFSEQTGVPAQLSGWSALTGRLPASMEIAIFRVIHEALDNVRRYARATRVQISLEQPAEQLIVTIQDNGGGFDLSTYGKTNAERRLGIVAMRDRAEFLGGKLHVFSQIGKGTRVVLKVPMPEHKPSPQRVKLV